MTAHQVKLIDRLRLETTAALAEEATREYLLASTFVRTLTRGMQWPRDCDQVKVWTTYTSVATGLFGWISDDE